MVPTHPRSLFSSHESTLLWAWAAWLTRISLLWVGFGLTRIPQISQVLLLRVGNLTEVGGHFRLTRISLLWVFLGLTPIQQEYSHGFRKKMIRGIRGIRGFQSATNEHKLSRIIFPCSDSCALSMDFWVERAWV